MKATGICLVAAVLLLGAGCCPISSETWTVTTGRDKTHQVEHIEIGDKFTIHEVRGLAEIEPHGDLAARWGFERQALLRVKAGYCLEVDFGPDHDPTPHGGDGHRAHWFVFKKSEDGSPRKLTVNHYTRAENQPCEERGTHAGTVHAEN